ncbi:MAG: biotin--[acetyl-CoA-carboxylase] ligase [Anaerolineae bacterium]|nr:biotin--[acetyl-CoA-carboxylase] ligase [Anaerolineae bacterium]MCB9108836.1 biotin--[acetyl-CoA-carboxylase] ligase [Anaerolineales bacterium]
MIKLSGDAIRHHLNTHTFGQSVIYMEQTGSTNTELKQLARSGAPEGLLYVADEQLVGRGRLKRSWNAPAGSSLLFSLLFRPGAFLQPIQTQRLTMICALALAESIEQLTGLTIKLKWPNDLMAAGGKKLCGILTEFELEGDRLSWVVVGLGLNVNVDFSQRTEPQADSGLSLAQTATSLSMLLERDTGALRTPLLQRCLEHVERRYEQLKQGQSPQQEWQARLMGLGQPVVVTNVSSEERWEGVMVGVDANGALRVEQANGSIETVLAGDVTLKRV